MQGWEYINGKQICTFYKKNNSNKKENLIIFFHGLGQHKAGAYFIFTQLAQCIKTKADTFQFDFYGCGDSEGDLEEVSYDIWLQEGEWLIKKHMRYYHRIIIISSGIGVAIANKIIKKYDNVYGIHIDYSNINLLKTDIYQAIFEYNSKDEEYIDTAVLFEKFRDAEKIFLVLGSWMNRSKGLYMKTDLLKNMMDSYNEIEITEHEYVVSSDTLYNCYTENNKVILVPSKSILTDVKIRERLEVIINDIYETISQM